MCSFSLFCVGITLNSYSKVYKFTVFTKRKQRDCTKSQLSSIKSPFRGQNLGGKDGESTPNLENVPFCRAKMSIQ